MVVCCICGIEWVPESVSFHKFPKSVKIRKRWLAAINKEITNFTLNINSKICGQHFTAECFIVTETGRRYLKSCAVPSVFDMPLKKKYILTQSNNVQTDKCENAHINEESCSETIININKIVTNNDLRTSCISMIKDRNLTKLDAIQSEMDISIINEEVIDKDQQQMRNEEYEVVVDTSHEKLASTIHNSKEKRVNLHKLDDSIAEQRTSKYGTIHSGILNAQRATEKRNEILRRKLKTSQQKCRRLQRKITFLALLIKHLQKKKLAQNK